MLTPAKLALRGAFFGSLMICFLCCILTTGKTSFDNPTTVRAANPVKVAHTTKCRISRKYPQTILQWCQLITSRAEQTGLAPDLVAALVWQESGGDPLAYSSSGAVGLMQVMPRDGLAASFTCADGPCFASRPSITELQDPEFNIQYGTAMLAGLIERSGSLREGLKAYGPMDVGYYYADKVLAIYNQYGE